MFIEGGQYIFNVVECRRTVVERVEYLGGLNARGRRHRGLWSLYRNDQQMQILVCIRPVTTDEGKLDAARMLRKLLLCLPWSCNARRRFVRGSHPGGTTLDCSREGVPCIRGGMIRRLATPDGVLDLSGGLALQGSTLYEAELAYPLGGVTR